MTEASNSFSAENLAMTKLRHFLYLGTEGNFYQQGQRTFTSENHECIQSLIDEGKGVEVVEEIMKFHRQLCSLYPDSLLYALALCAHSRDMRTKMSAYEAVKEICASADSLFIFTHFMEEVGKPGTGWGRAHRKSVSEWYNNKDPKELAAEITKVKSRHKWCHKDILRLAHVKSQKTSTAAVLQYIFKDLETAEKEFAADPEAADVLEYLKNVDEVKHTTDVQVAARLVEMHNLSFEHIPTPLLKSKEIWTCLIPRLQLPVLLQQIPRLNKLGFLKQNSPLFKLLEERIQCENSVISSKLGPLETFVVARRCDISRILPVKALIRPRHSHLDAALNNLHLTSFKVVQPTGKRFLVAVDVRNTMVHSRTVGCSSLSPADCVAVVLMSLARAEGSNLSVVGFSTKEMAPININNKMMFADVTRRMREIPIGPVNLAAPLQWATEKKKQFDVIIIFTDNQTVPGDVHPANALKEYRKSQNLPNARLIVCALLSHGFSLAPPDETGMLDIAGFSVKIFQIIQDFAQGVF